MAVLRHELLEAARDLRFMAGRYGSGDDGQNLRAAGLMEKAADALNQREAVSAEPDFGEDNAGHDTDCDCKACLIDTWHAEVDELRAQVERQRAEYKLLERDYKTTAEDLRHALQWALTYWSDDEPEDGEAREDYTGATRLAWPDNPEEWAPEDFNAL